MPEPVLAAEGEQGEQTATAQPQSVVDKPETTTQSEGQSPSDAKAVMDLLDIPEELRDQISPKAISTEPETETPETEPETEEEIPEVDGKKKKEEQKPEEESEEDDAEGEDEEKEEEKPTEQKIDKRQKRINRLTRIRNDLEKQVDHVLTQVEERDSKIKDLQEKVQKYEKNGSAPVGTIPQVGPWMPDTETAEQYSELSQKKVAADARLRWCNAHSEGVTIVENGQEKFLGPDDIAHFKNEANEVLMEVNPEIKVIEREAKQTFKHQKAEFEKVTYHIWPELAKKDSPEYQEFTSIEKEFPTIAATPAGKYYIGLAIEGKKSLEAKLAAKQNGNGNGKTKARRDIDPKVFTTPRVPIAPHTAEPPTRESVPSSHKKLNEATSSFMDDQDGSAESLARVFQARDEAAAVRPAARSSVRS